LGKKRVVWLLVVLGAALFALSAFADPIGLGDGDGIGWKQSIGMVIGAAALIAGLALLYVRRADTGSAQAEI
jgi:hypothetical protein